MHVAALGYPDNANEAIRQQYKNFYIAIGNVLPCGKCRKHFAEHFAELPIDLYLYDKTSLFAWTVKFHNIVNKETGKREWTTSEANAFYTTGKYAEAPVHDKNTRQISDVLLVLNAFMLIAILAFIVYRFISRRNA